LSDYTLIDGSASCYTCATGYRSSEYLLTLTDPLNNAIEALRDAANNGL